jgi:hypothetical protein
MHERVSPELSNARSELDTAHPKLGPMHAVDVAAGGLDARPKADVQSVSRLMADLSGSDRVAGVRR